MGSHTLTAKYLPVPEVLRARLVGIDYPCLILGQPIRKACKVIVQRWSQRTVQNCRNSMCRCITCVSEEHRLMS